MGYKKTAFENENGFFSIEISRVTQKRLQKEFPHSLLYAV